MSRFKPIILLPFVASNILATCISCNKDPVDPSIRIECLTDRDRSLTVNYADINSDTSYDFDFYFRLSQKYHHIDDYVTIRIENYLRDIQWIKIEPSYGHFTYKYLTYDLGQLVWISHEQGLFYYPFKIKYERMYTPDPGPFYKPIYTYTFDLVLEYLSTDGIYCSTNYFKNLSIVIDAIVDY